MNQGNHNRTIVTPLIENDTQNNQQFIDTIDYSEYEIEEIDSSYQDDDYDSDSFPSENIEANEYDYYNEYSGDAATNFINVEYMSLDDILQVSATKRIAMDDPCMVVVGSFQRRDLLDKMINTLSELSYNIYIEKYGGFYRTAIIYECQTKNSIDFLHEIRSTIEQKAWILSY